MTRLVVQLLHGIPAGRNPEGESVALANLEGRVSGFHEKGEPALCEAKLSHNRGSEARGPSPGARPALLTSGLVGAPLCSPPEAVPRLQDKLPGISVPESA